MKKVEDITFHYTQEKMVKDLMKFIPFSKKDLALDAGSGRNKIWQKNCSVECLECELEDGCDFLTDWNTAVDWVLGNPPYHLSWKFTEKALTLANKGIAWLINNQALNSHFTPARLDKIKELGFTYSKIHVVADKRWFGRYYFIILEKKENDFISWERKTY